MSGLPELIHHAAGPVSLDRSRRYAQKTYAFELAKPDGLWVSVPGEQDWKSFCTSEKFALEHLAAEHSVTLKPGSNILHVGDVSAFDRFTAEYLTPDENPHYSDGMAIDWQRVVAHHDGIVIAPYRWDRRGKHRWYSGWDCASGCIWNLNAIESFDALP
jgi:hypothetical protein